MAKTQHDTSRYTAFGLLLDDLLHRKQMSYRQLAMASGMSATSAMSIIRACRGESTPERANILKWGEVLGASPEQRAALLHAFHYTEEEEQGSASARIAELEQELKHARMHIAELEQELAQWKKRE